MDFRNQYYDAFVAFLCLYDLIYLILTYSRVLEPAVSASSILAILISLGLSFSCVTKITVL